MTRGRPRGPDVFATLSGICAGFCALVGSARSTFRPVRPLAPARTALGVSLGGPLLQPQRTVFPTPILSLGGAAV